MLGFKKWWWYKWKVYLSHPMDSYRILLLVESSGGDHLVWYIIWPVSWYRILLLVESFGGDHLVLYVIWPVTPQIRHGYGRGTPWTWILHIKSGIPDMIWHDLLPILKYPCTIAYDYIKYVIHNIDNKTFMVLWWLHWPKRWQIPWISIPHIQITKFHFWNF